MDRKVSIPKTNTRLVPRAITTDKDGDALATSKRNAETFLASDRKTKVQNLPRTDLYRSFRLPQHGNNVVVGIDYIGTGTVEGAGIW